MKKKNPNKRLRLFDIARDGKGIGKSDVDNSFGLKRFFVSYKDNFNKILYANIFMVLGNFPLIFLIAALSGYTKVESYVPMFDLFQNLVPFASFDSPTPDSLLLYSLEGLHSELLVPTTGTYVLYGLSALTLLTFGVVNVGTAYILRNIVMGEPVFTWSDFWYAVKRNYKQALPFGAIDLGIIALLISNIYTMTIRAGSYFTNTMFWCNVVLLVLYFVMRFYIYVQMVTFKLSVYKMLKNSLILALVGFKRNFVCMLGIILGVVLELSFIFSFGGIFIPLAVAAPLAILFSTFAYMKVYAAYYKIKTIMIDPYQTDKKDTHSEDDVVMRDDVTEKQRLEEIKRRNGITG